MISKNNFTLDWDDESYQITWIKNKKCKNITLSYIDNLHFRLSTPWNTSLQKAEESAIKLIPKVLEKIQKKFGKSQQLYLDLPHFIFCLYGQPLDLLRILPTIDTNEWTHSLTYRQQYFKYLNVYLLNRGQDLFMARLKTWFQIMGLNCQLPTIEFKWIKTKWGSYNRNTHHLIFNTKLLCFPWSLVDLIIVHELVHLVHYHHQKSFYQLLEYYLPNYLHLEAQLVAFV